MYRVADVRRQLKLQYHTRNRHDKTSMVELIGASFVADEPTIIGDPNYDYIDREIAWYDSQSLNVYDIPGKVPSIWESISSTKNEINSNYGYLLYSEENGRQFDQVLHNLRTKPDGRQAVAIYTRPSMHEDWSRDGMRDFVCTNAVNYFLRYNRLHAVVQMRSNDVVFGYRNDYAWQLEVMKRLVERLPGTVLGSMTWQAASLHVYPRHFHLLEEL